MTDTPNPSDLAAILRDVLKNELARISDEWLQRRPFAPLYAHDWRAGSGITREEADLTVARDALAALRRDIATNNPDDLVMMAADRLIAERGLPVADRGRVALGLLEVYAATWQARERRLLGLDPIMLDELAPAPAPISQRPPGPDCGTATTAPEALPSASVPATSPLASALIDPFFVHREKIDRTRHQVMGQERTTLRLFREVCGDRPVADYRRGDVTTFLGTLRRLPNTYGRSPRDRTRTVAEIIAEADSRGAPRLTDKTVKRHLSAVSQFFRFAVDAGHLTVAARSEMVDSHRFGAGQRARSQRDAWTSEELTKLFKSPIWTGCRRSHRTQAGDEVIRDAKFWLPILALFHGARLEEFADLYRRDVACDDGTWFVALTEAAPEDALDEGEGAEGRRLKNANAERNVPIHPEVIRLGFLHYIAKTAPNPNDPLFPDLRPQGEDRRRGASVTRWFVVYRRAVGVYRPGVGMHAFRHTAITRLTDAITDFQQKRHRDYLMGHGGGTTEGDARYDKGPGLKAAAETLALLRYPEVDLSHLYVDVE